MTYYSLTFKLSLLFSFLVSAQAIYIIHGPQYKVVVKNEFGKNMSIVCYKQGEPSVTTVQVRNTEEHVWRGSTTTNGDFTCLCHVVLYSDRLYGGGADVHCDEETYIAVDTEQRSQPYHMNSHRITEIYWILRSDGRYNLRFPAEIRFGDRWVNLSRHFDSTREGNGGGCSVM